MNLRLRRMKCRLVLVLALICSGSSAGAWGKGIHVCTDVQCVIEDVASYTAPRVINYVAPYVSNTLLGSALGCLAPTESTWPIFAVGGLGLAAATALYLRKNPGSLAYYAKLGTGAGLTFAASKTVNYLSAQLPSQWSEFERHSVVTGVATVAWAYVHKDKLQSREFYKSIGKSIFFNAGRVASGNLFRSAVEYFRGTQQKKIAQPSQALTLKLTQLQSLRTINSHNEQSCASNCASPNCVSSFPSIDMCSPINPDQEGSFVDDFKTSQKSRKTAAQRRSRPGSKKNPGTPSQEQQIQKGGNNRPLSSSENVPQGENLANAAPQSWAQTIHQHASPVLDSTVSMLWLQLFMSSPSVQSVIVPLQTRLYALGQQLWPWPSPSEVRDHDHDEHDHANCSHPSNHTDAFLGAQAFVTDGWTDDKMCYLPYSGR